MQADKIIICIDSYLTKNNLESIGAVVANALLSKEGLLKDYKYRPGAPLRNLLRNGKIPHAN